MRVRSSACIEASALAKWLRASASAVSRNCLVLIASARLVFKVSIGVNFKVCSASVWRNKNAVFSSLFTLILIFNSLILLSNILVLKFASWNNFSACWIESRNAAYIISACCLADKSSLFAVSSGSSCTETACNAAFLLASSFVSCVNLVFVAAISALILASRAKAVCCACSKRANSNCCW